MNTMISMIKKAVVSYALVCAFVAPLQGMNYIQQGYNTVKRGVQNHPYATVLGLTTTAATAGVAGYYLWKQNRKPAYTQEMYEAAKKQLELERHELGLRHPNRLYNQRIYHPKNLSLAISTSDQDMITGGERWNNNQLRVWKEQPTEAATTIQSALRGYQEQKKLDQTKDSITTIQSALRGYKEHRNLEETKDSATTIQSALRGYQTQKQYKPAKQQQDQENEQARKSYEDALRNHFHTQDALAENIQNAVRKMSHLFIDRTFSRLGAGNDVNAMKAQALEEQEAIKRGARYATELLKDKSVLSKPDFYAQINGYDKEESTFAPYSSVEDYAQVLRDLCSFFYFIGCEQGRLDHTGFEEGTFFIEDSKGHLKAFLEKFIQKTIINAIPKGEKQKFARRISTHKFGEQQFGIDLWSDEQPWLFRFKHLLVGLDQHGIWMKPEKHGIDKWKDWTLHGVDLAQTKIVKIRSRFTGEEGDDASKYNKERVPAWETNEFKKLFPDCSGKDMTLGKMYTYACEALQNNPKNALHIKNFIDAMYCHYNHINGRHGREIRLTGDELLMAYAYTTPDIDVINFLNEFMALKHAVAQYQHGNYDHFETVSLRASQTLRDSMQRKHVTQDVAYQALEQKILNLMAEYKRISKTVDRCSAEIALYFTPLEDILRTYHREGILKANIASQQIFESEFHRFFYVQKQQQLQQQELLANKENLSVAVMDCLEEFKKCSFKTIGVYFPGFKSTGLEVDKKQLKNITHEGLRNYLEKYILDLQQTEGLRKTTELRIFTGQKYKGDQFIRFNEPIIQALYELALSAQTDKRSSYAETSEDKQKQVLTICKTVNTAWQKLLYETIPALAEKHGKVFSLSAKGQEIMHACMQETGAQFDEMNKFYTEIYEELVARVEDDDWKETYHMILKKKENDYNIRKETTRNFCRLADSEQAFKDDVLQELNRTVKADLACREVSGNLECDWIAQSEVFKKVIEDQNKGYVDRATDAAKATGTYLASFIWKR